MKKRISVLVYRVYDIVLHFLLFLYRVKNINKKKILIYTDSRGHEITKTINKRNPFSGYSKYFIKNYCSFVYICPEKHTTFFDVLYFLEKNKIEFKELIIHVGVVDFASRTKSQTLEVLNKKKEKIIFLFGEDKFNQLINFDGYDIDYLNEQTSSIIPAFFISSLAEKLNQYSELIWISSNPIDLTWKGNYSRDRPSNSNLIIESTTELIKQLNIKKIINFSQFSNDEIKKYTCDNIHLSEEGMCKIESEIKKII